MAAGVQQLLLKNRHAHTAGIGGNIGLLLSTVFGSGADPNPDPDPPDPHVFGPLDPDPLVRGMDPDPALSPSKNSKKKP